MKETRLKATIENSEKEKFHLKKKQQIGEETDENNEIFERIYKKALRRKRRKR